MTIQIEDPAMRSGPVTVTNILLLVVLLLNSKADDLMLIGKRQEKFEGRSTTIVDCETKLLLIVNDMLKVTFTPMNIHVYERGEIWTAKDFSCPCLTSELVIIPESSIIPKL